MRSKRCILKIISITILITLVLGWNPAMAAEQAHPDVLQEVIDAIERHYVKDVEKNALMEAAIEGILDVIKDPYANYMDMEAYQDFLEGLEGSFGGIGVSIELKDNYITVVSVFEGGPAFKANIEPGSRLLEADGQSLVGIPLNEAAKIIRGEPGTTVSLKVAQPDSHQVLQVELIREIITVPTVEWRIIEDGIGYIKITSFKDNTPSEVYEAIPELQDAGMKALVLDLRNNPGGLLSESVAVAEALVPSGPIVHVEKKGGIRQTFSSESKRPPMPLAVLVNGGSASGAEIVAGAIQDRGMGYLVGTRTFGKGTVQSLLPLETGGGLKITTAEYLLPSGKSLEGKGLEPDFPVERGKPQAVRIRVGLAKGPDLRPGSRGEEVQGLQEDLGALGYDPGPVDGAFGPLTCGALLGFQRDHGVEPTGTLDLATREALVKALEAKALEDPQLDKALEVLRKFL